MYNLIASQEYRSTVEGLDSKINNNMTELRQDGAVRAVLLRRLEQGYDIYV